MPLAIAQESHVVSLDDATTPSRTNTNGFWLFMKDRMETSPLMSLTESPEDRRKRVWQTAIQEWRDDARVSNEMRQRYREQAKKKNAEAKSSSSTARSTQSIACCAAYRSPQVLSTPWGLGDKKGALSEYVLETVTKSVPSYVASGDRNWKAEHSTMTEDKHCKHVDNK